MNSQIIDFINQKFGCSISADYYNKYISLWEDWWRGYHKPFHHFLRGNGMGNPIERDIYSLKMAKKVCEDWASILLNEKTRITFEDEKASEFIQGKKETGGIFGCNDFWSQANRLIEKAFYSGTAAVTIRLENARNRNGRLEADGNTKIRFGYVAADRIIPISADCGRITEAAFCSEHIVKGRKYLLLEVHVLEDGCYVIKNYWFCIDGGVLVNEQLPDNIPPEFRTGSELPWFAVVSPNIENNIPYSNGLGVSVLHGAIDILKGIDIAYNNFVKDFELGGKKVFMQKSLTEVTTDGNVIAPDDVGQQLFYYLPANLTGGSSEPLIHEFNPTIRIEENREGIQAQLDYLSFVCGLGNKHYQFNAGSIVTATQYTGDKQDLIQNAHKHYANVEKFLLSIVRTLIDIGNRYFDLGADPEAEIEVQFDKSVIIDEAAERAQDMQDVRDKAMALWEYRMKWYSEDEETAKKMIAEIMDEQSVDLGFEDEE